MLTEPASDEDSTEIREVIRRYLSDRFPSERVRELALTAEGYAPDDWKHMSEMGWPALGIGEEAGGAGYGAVQQCVLHEEAGRALVPGPLLASVGFALPALEACGGADAAELITRLTAGDGIAALVQDGHQARLTVHVQDGPLRIDGVADLVLDGQSAAVLVVVSETSNGPVVLTVDAAVDGVTVTPVAVVDSTRRFARVEFSGAPANLLPIQSRSRLASARDVTSLFVAAQMVGGAGRAVELTLDYLRDRHQFGRPIGSFQALKHRAADMAVSVALARELVYSAAELLAAEAWDDLGVAAPAALLQGATVYQAATEEGIQLHGGIGFTEEHDIGLYYRRAIVDRDLCGPPVDVQERLARTLIA
jgi:alkylation response protein AidB-like acyl-CoA dehydrogenase